MLTKNFVITIVGITVAILALCNLDFNKQPVVENWWGGIQFTTRAMPGAMVNGKETAISGNYLDPSALMGSGKFVSTPGYQAVLSPRFSNVQYGANIRYNMPDRENQATPCNPLTFGDMAQENYKPPLRDSGAPSDKVGRENYCNGGSGECASGTPPSCGKGGYGLGHKVAGGYEVPAGYTNGNYQDVYNNLPGPVVSKPCGSGQGNANADLPIGTMTTMDGAGNTDQFIAFNRIMVANTRSSSRLYGQADYIRGDLAILPHQTGWYSVYPDISRDVNAGAMNTLAGAGGGGESYNQLMKLLVNASGGVNLTLGGCDLGQELPKYNTNMANSQITSLSNSMTDVNVSSFP